MFDAFNDTSLDLCGQNAAYFLAFEFMNAADYYSMKEAWLRRAKKPDDVPRET